MVQWRKLTGVQCICQPTLATGTFETYRKPTRRERFLAEMDKVVPWQGSRRIAQCLLSLGGGTRFKTDAGPAGLDERSAGSAGPR